MTLNKLIQKQLSPLFWGGWVGILLLLSCTGEDIGEIQPDTPEHEPVPIRFEIGFAPETRVATDANFTTTWESGDEIGVFIVKGNDGLQSSGNHVDNLKLTYSSGTWTQSPLPVGKEYYPTDGSSLSFYAYYPYRASIDPTNALFSIQQNQSSEANYNNSELLIAKTENYRLNPAAIPLNLSHAHALLQIEVVQQGNSISNNNLELAITDIAVSVNADLAIGTDTRTTQRQVVRMYKVPGLSATYRALIPPQTLSGNSEIKFFNGVSEKRSYTGLRLDKMTAGKVHKYKLTVTDLGL